MPLEASPGAARNDGLTHEQLAAIHSANVLADDLIGNPGFRGDQEKIIHLFSTGKTAKEIANILFQKNCGVIAGRSVPTVEVLHTAITTTLRSVLHPSEHRTQKTRNAVRVQREARPNILGLAIDQHHNLLADIVRRFNDGIAAENIARDLKASHAIFARHSIATIEFQIKATLRERLGQEQYNELMSKVRSRASKERDLTKLRENRGRRPGACEWTDLATSTLVAILRKPKYKKTRLDEQAFQHIADELNAICKTEPPFTWEQCKTKRHHLKYHKK